MFILVVIAFIVIALVFANHVQRKTHRVSDEAILEGLPIVGESHYLSTLRSIAGDGEVRYRCEAVVEPEPTNHYDPNAVKVSINEKIVGYLAHEDAPLYIKKYGSAANSCDAIIVGGGPGRSNLGVWLHLRL